MSQKNKSCSASLPLSGKETCYGNGVPRRSKTDLSPPGLKAIVLEDGPPPAGTVPTGNGATVYQAHPSDVIMSRYHVQGLLGYGSFGTVVAAQDAVTGRSIAVKLLHKGAQQDVKREERVYDLIVGGCSPSFQLFAEVLGSGQHRGFHCILFELCQMSLFDVLTGTRSLVPFPQRHVCEIGHQLLRGIAYLHSLGIVHTDIKPDNIVFKNNAVVTVRELDPENGFKPKRVLVSTELRIVDLGCAGSPGMKAPFGEAMKPGTPGYRAPEITLGMPWSFEIDQFGIGCVLAEATMLRNIFEGDSESDREQLAFMDRIVGPFPEDYAAEVERVVPGTFSFCGRVTVLYPAPGTPLTRAEHSKPVLRIERARPLSTLIHERDLYNLLKALLCPDPVRRPSCEDALKHKYFDMLRDR